MKVTVSDVISPSYFVATAAVELGFFEGEGVDAEFVHPPVDVPEALRDGALDFVGASPYLSLSAFPGWRGGKILCALAHYTYWFIAVRADLNAKRGDIGALKGLRISAAPQVGLALKLLLEEAGMDMERDNVRIVPPPTREQIGSWARLGARAIEEGSADGFWGNGLRAAYAERKGVATPLLDIRRGDGPPAARMYTFPALVASERLIAEHPEAAAGAVRAIVKTQQALKADPSLAVKAAGRLFPPEELEMISNLIALDAPFYDPTVTEEMIAKAIQFARDIGQLSEPVSYERAVATQFRELWKG